MFLGYVRFSPFSCFYRNSFRLLLHDISRNTPPHHENTHIAYQPIYTFPIQALRVFKTQDFKVCLSPDNS